MVLLLWALILISLYSPILGILFIIISTSTVFPLSLFPQVISFGEIGLYFPEALALVLLISIFFKGVVRRDLQKLNSYGTVLMLILFYWIIFSMVYAVLLGKSSLINSILEARPFLYYMNYFLILYYITTKKDLVFLFNGLILVSLITCVLIFVQYILGFEHKLFPWYEWIVGKISFRPGEPGITRVFPNANAVVYTLFFPTLILTLNKVADKIWYKIFLVTAVLSFFLSFTRNIYFSVLIGLFLTWLILRGRVKKLLLRRFITIILLGILIAYIPVHLGLIQVTNWWQLALLRTQEALESGVTGAQTMISRTKESTVILEKISQSPILGNGIGTHYYNPVIGVKWGYVHNGYLGIIFQMGIIGLIIHLLFFYNYIKISLECYKKVDDIYSRNIVLGFLISFLALLPAVIAKPVFVEEYFWISLIGLTYTIPAVIIKISDQEKNISGGSVSNLKV